MFVTNANAFVTINLTSGSTVRTMLFSSRDMKASINVGLTISVGDSYGNSTKCLNSTTGYSTWITCNEGKGAVGSFIYMANTTSKPNNNTYRG
jgi:hypothetical protein